MGSVRVICRVSQFANILILSVCSIFTNRINSVTNRFRLGVTRTRVTGRRVAL